MPNPIEIQKYLGGIDYPASKQTIADAAKNSGANDDVIEALNRIEDKQYEDPTEITSAVM